MIGHKSQFRIPAIYRVKEREGEKGKKWFVAGQWSFGLIGFCLLKWNLSIDGLSKWIVHKLQRKWVFKTSRYMLILVCEIVCDCCLFKRADWRDWESHFLLCWFLGIYYSEHDDSRRKGEHTRKYGEIMRRHCTHLSPISYYWFRDWKRVLLSGVARREQTQLSNTESRSRNSDFRYTCIYRGFGLTSCSFLHVSSIQLLIDCIQTNFQLKNRKKKWNVSYIDCCCCSCCCCWFLIVYACRPFEDDM